jgi:hypothetical protein
VGDVRFKRVGNQSRQQQAGDGFGQFHVVPEKTIRHDRAGRTHRFVAEQNRLGRRQRPDAMMINDLDDLDFIRALHRLRQFVVIHQDQLAIHRLEEVRLRQNANGLALLCRAPERSDSRNWSPHRAPPPAARVRGST